MYSIHSYIRFKQIYSCFKQLFSVHTKYIHLFTKKHIHTKKTPRRKSSFIEAHLRGWISLSTMWVMVFDIKFYLSDLAASNFTIQAMLMTPDLLCLFFAYI